MIKVLNPDSRADGFEIVRQIVHRRVAPSAIKDALNLLIEKTGGVLRHASKCCKRHPT